MRPEQLDRLNACVEDWRAHKDTDATEMFDDYDMECLIALLAEVERLRVALEEIVSLGTIESIQQTRIAEGALRGEGEK